MDVVDVTGAIGPMLFGSVKAKWRLFDLCTRLLQSLSPTSTWTPYFHDAYAPLRRDLHIEVDLGTPVLHSERGNVARARFVLALLVGGEAHVLGNAVLVEDDTQRLALDPRSICFQNVIVVIDQGIALASHIAG